MVDNNVVYYGLTKLALILIMKKHKKYLSLIALLLGILITKGAGSADFTGKWEGNEQCQGASAAVAIVVITADGANQVFITGVYSLQGKVRGVVKGNTITIPRQSVVDPNLKNFMIEGSLTIGKNHTTLTGVLAVLNNDQRDNCTVNYHK